MQLPGSKISGDGFASASGSIRDVARFRCQPWLQTG